MSQEMQDAILKLQQQLQELRNDKQKEREDNPMDEDEGDLPDDDNVEWSKVLGQEREEVTRDEAKVFTTLLKSPPPLGRVREIVKTVVKYQGVPETPSHRSQPQGSSKYGNSSGRLDQRVQGTQVKLEAAMHLMVAQLETGDSKNMGLASAMIRSAWEDLNENRRHLAAGRQRYALEQRQDITEARLLTKEEEEKVRKARAFNPGSRGRRPEPPDASSTSWTGNWKPNYSQNWTKPSQGRGKGKGKGSQK